MKSFTTFIFRIALCLSLLLAYSYLSAQITTVDEIFAPHQNNTGQNNQDMNNTGNQTNTGTMNYGVENKPYPNPSTGIFKIKLNQIEDVAVRVYNSHGKVFETSIHYSGEISVNISQLPTGFYFLRLTSTSIDQAWRIQKIN